MNEHVVRVLNFPHDQSLLLILQLEDQLENDEKVEIQEGDNYVDVGFVNEKDAQNLLKSGVIIVNGKEYKVSAASNQKHEEQETTFLQITGINNLFEGFLWMYLESKTGGRPIKILNFSSSEGYATCSCLNQKGLDKILEDKHPKIDKCEIKFLQIPGDLADFKNLSCGIKVGMSSMLSELELKIIFGRDGHEIEDLYITQQYAVMTYNTPEGAQQHLGINCFEHVSFSVDRMTPTFSPSVGESSEVYNTTFLLSNLPLTFENEKLIGYFNKYLKAKDIIKVLYARSKPGLAVVVFNSPQEFCLLQRVIYSKPFNDKMLKIEQIQRSRSILVFNIRDVPLKLLRNYFESQSWKIEDFFIGDEFAILKFRDSSYVEKIVNTTNHAIKGKKFDVSIYFDKLGIIYPGEKNSDCKCWLQKCISFECKSHIVNFLLNCEKQRSLIDAKIESIYGIIDWPKNFVDDSKSVELKVKITFHQICDIEEFKTWEKNCLSLIDILMESFSTHKTNLIEQLCSSVVSRLFEKLENKKGTINKGEMKMCDDVLVHLKGDVLVVSGLKSEVEKTAKLIDEIHLEEGNKIQREMSKVTYNVGLKSIKIDYLKRENKFLESCKVGFEFHDSENLIILKGLPDDVRKAEIGIQEFLLKTSIKRFNCDIFISELLKKSEILNHVYDIFQKNGLTVAISMDDAVKMSICATDDSNAKKAFEILKDELLCDNRHLDKSEQETLTKSEWKKILKEFDENPHIMVKLINDANTLIIQGLKDAVTKASKSIHAYFDEHVIVQNELCVPKGKYSFIKNHLNDELEKLIDEENIKIKGMPNHFSFQMEGSLSQMKLAKEKVDGLLNRVQMFKRTIARPGFRGYIESDQGRLALQAITMNTKTYIDISSNEINDNTNETLGNLKCASVSLTDSVTLNVVLGDILLSDADVIVNAANKMLHHMGGVAGAISKAAGPGFQSECYDYVHKRGELKVGETFISSPGSLKFKAIVNVAGPIYDKSSANDTELYEAVSNVLKAVEGRQLHKVALPAISTGIYAFPLELASKTILKCIKDHARNCIHLTSVEIVDINFEIIKEFQKNIKEMFFENEILFYKEVPSVTNKSTDARDLVRNSEALGKQNKRLKQKASESCSNPKHPPLKFVKGSLVDQSVDVIVNSASSDLNLKNGMISSLILNKAGPSMQQACQEYTQRNGNLNYGDIFVSKGFNLPCQFVFHGVCAAWGSHKNLSEQSIRLLTKNSLEEASKLKLKSFAMPAFGTGKLNIPGALVAKWMYEETDDFFSKNPKSSLIDLRLVVYEKDYKVIKDFEEFFSCAKSGSGDMERRLLKKQSMENIDNDLEKGFIITISKVSVVVCSGDLTEEESDAIVNCTDEDYNFSNGNISKAIIRKGGKMIEEECRKLGKLNIISVTKSGNLKCKCIFHVNLRRELSVVDACLSKAEELKLSSLSFPLLKTGLYSKGAAAVAQAMFVAFEVFARSNPLHLKNIRVVVHENDQLHEVQKCLREPNGLLKRFLKTYIKSELSYPQNEYFSSNAVSSVMHIYAFSKLDANKAEKALEESMTSSVQELKIDNWKETIAHLNEEEKSEIMQYEKKFDVKIAICNKTITIKGINIAEANLGIINILKSVDERIRDSKECGEIFEKVHWLYKDKDYKAYHPEINFLIEKAFRARETKVSWQESAGLVEIDFHKMEECVAGVTHHVKRWTLDEVLPQHWDVTMDNVIRVLEVIPGSQEYKKIDRDVYQTSGQTVNSIEKIERIQNIALYKRYAIKKEELAREHANRNTCIDQALWHAASVDIVSEISAQGFNRSKDIRPASATQLGHGNYFFKSFCDAHQAKPDSSGTMYAYLCPVITGRYAVGSANLRDVPSDNLGRFNSVVDDSSNPTTFVIFNDNQAYPEYLIHYK